MKHEDFMKAKQAELNDQWMHTKTVQANKQSDVDMVDHPPHYNASGIECIDAIEAACGEGFEYYLQGNIIKYLWRYRYKNGMEDLQKAQWYLAKLINEQTRKELS